MTINKKLASVLIVLGLVAGNVAAATSAQADNIGNPPAGCSLSPSSPTVSASRVYWRGTGVCPISLVSQMNSRLIHNYDNLPDYNVANVSTFSGPNWSAGSNTCDGGGTTDYYTELAFYYKNGSGDTQRVSNTVSLTHC